MPVLKASIGGCQGTKAFFAHGLHVRHNKEKKNLRSLSLSAIMFPMKNVAGGPFNLKHSMHAFRYPENKYKMVPIVIRIVNDHRSDEQARSSCKVRERKKWI